MPPEFCSDEAGRSIVEADMAAIVSKLESSIAGFSGAILAGSFGRGEGVVEIVDGRRTAANDYDIAVLFPTRPSALIRKRLRALSASLPLELGVRHVDLIAITFDDLEREPTTMFLYDTIRAGTPLGAAGDRLEHRRLKPASSPPFPAEEIRNLLINRMVTLLEGHPGVDCGLSLPQKARQTSKAYWAVADSALYRAGRYCTHYHAKSAALQEIGTSSGLSAEFLQAREVGYSLFKGDCILHTSAECTSFWNLCRTEMLRELLQVSSSIDAEQYSNVRAMFPRWRGSHAVGTETIRAGVALLKGRKIRRTVEKDIARQLEIAPTSGAGDAWLTEAAALIRAWYDS